MSIYRFFDFLKTFMPPFVTFETDRDLSSLEDFGFDYFFEASEDFFVCESFPATTKSARTPFRRSDFSLAGALAS